MKFLKKQVSEEETEKIQVNKLYTLQIQCVHCDEWDMMEGGPMDNRKAKFLCGKCGKINTIDWKFDF